MRRRVKTAGARQARGRFRAPQGTLVPAFGVAENRRRRSSCSRHPSKPFERAPPAGGFRSYPEEGFGWRLSEMGRLNPREIPARMLKPLQDGEVVSVKQDSHLEMIKIVHGMRKKRRA